MYRSSSSCPTKLATMTMPLETWNGIICSSINLTQFSRSPGWVRYSRNSKNMTTPKNEIFGQVGNQCSIAEIRCQHF